MIDKSAGQAFDWSQYLDFEISTADGSLIGFVTGIVSGAENGETFFCVEGTDSWDEELQVPVSAVGIISEGMLMLDVAVDQIGLVVSDDLAVSERFTERDDTHPAGQSGPGIRPGNDRRESSPLNSYSDPVHQRADPLMRLAESPVPDQRRFARRGVRRRTDRSRNLLEVRVTRMRSTEQSLEEVSLLALHHRTFILEQLVLDMYVRHGHQRARTIPGETSNAPGVGSMDQHLTRDHLGVLAEEYERFSERSLADLDLIYLFAGPVYESFRRSAGLSEDFLASWAICADGNQVLLHVTLGDRESSDDWNAHFQSLLDRDIALPATITTGGSPGLIRSVGESFPGTRRIRCWSEKMQNVLDEAPATIRPGLELWLRSIRDAPDHDYGEEVAHNVIEKFDADYPDAMREFVDDLHASLTHLWLPVTHRRVVRVATLPEQTIMEDWNGVLNLENLRNQGDGLLMVYGILRQSIPWLPRLGFTSSERRQVDDLRQGPVSFQ